MTPSPQELVRRLMAAGWSQGQIARALGTTQPTVWRMAYKECKTHSHTLVDALRDLAEAHELLTDDETTSD